MPGLSFDSVVSIALLIAIVGAAIRLSAVLTELRLEVKRLRQEMVDGTASIRKVSNSVRHLENHLIMFEEDVNNLFAAVRANPHGERALEITRKSRFMPHNHQDK